MIYALPNNLSKTETVKLSNINSYEKGAENFNAEELWKISIATEADGTNPATYYITSGTNYLAYGKDGDSANTKLRLVSDESLAAKWTIGTTESGDYYFQSDAGRVALLNNSGTNPAIGHYASGNLTSEDYGLVTLYKVSTEQAKTITYEQSVGGTFTCVSSTGVLEGLYRVDTVTLTLNPDEGNMVYSVTLVDGEGEVLETYTPSKIGNSYTCVFNATTSGKVVVEFGEAKALCDINLDNSAGHANVVNLGSSYFVEEKVEFIINSDAGWYVDTVTAKLGETPISVAVDGNNYSFTIPASDENVVVNVSYTTKQYVKLDVTANDNADISVNYSDASAYTSGTAVKQGTELVFDVEVKAGYEVSKILVNGEEFNGDTIELNENSTLALEVVEITYTDESFTDFDTVISEIKSTLSTKTYFVIGTVKSWSYNSQYKSYTAVITDGTNELTIHSGNLKEGVNAPNVGDTIVAYGHSKLYSGTNELTGDANNPYPVYLSVTHNTYNVTSTVVDESDNPVTGVVTIDNLPATITSGTPAEFTMSVNENYNFTIETTNCTVTVANSVYKLEAYGAANVKVVVSEKPVGVVEYSYDFTKATISTSKLSVEQLKTAFADSANGDDIVTAVSSATNMYGANTSQGPKVAGLKSGTSSATGSFTITTSETVSKVYVSCYAWSATSGDTVSVNGSATQKAGAGTLAVLEFDISDATTITFTFSKRVVIQNITFVSE